MTTETCSTVTEACAEALSPAELIAARARRDRIENAVLDREAEEHPRESWEAFIARMRARTEAERPKGGERG